ncbi:MAG: hypothetical protein ABI333_24335 [bacterium]
MRRLLAIALGITVSFGFSATVEATVLRSLSLAELCERSPTIVRGTVLRRQSYWANGRILTAVTMQVERSLRGTKRKGALVTFWRLGGRVGRYAQRVLGAPTFRRGERVVVFLKRRAGRLFVTGMVQGRFFITGTRASLRVHPTSPGVALLGPRRALRAPVALSVFEKSVQTQLQASIGRRR